MATPAILKAPPELNFQSGVTGSDRYYVVEKEGGTADATEIHFRTSYGCPFGFDGADGRC